VANSYRPCLKDTGMPPDDPGRVGDRGAEIPSSSVIGGKQPAPPFGVAPKGVRTSRMRRE